MSSLTPEVEAALDEVAPDAVFHGNSVGYIYDKMLAYRRGIDRVNKALGDMVDGETPCWEHVATLRAENARLTAIALTDDGIAELALLRTLYHSCGIDYAATCRAYAELKKWYLRGVVKAKEATKNAE
jgi:hypothetical protein